MVEFTVRLQPILELSDADENLMRRAVVVEVYFARLSAELDVGEEMTGRMGDVGNNAVPLRVTNWNSWALEPTRQRPKPSGIPATGTASG